MKSSQLLLTTLLVAVSGSLGPVCGQVLETPVAVLDDSGRPVSGAAASDLEVRLDGRPATVEGLETDEAPWEIVVYFEARLSRSASVRRLARELSERVQDLVRLGTVELVAADPEPRTLLLGNDQPVLLNEALTRLYLNGLVGDELTAIRQSLLEPDPAAPDGLDMEDVRAALLAELRLLREQRSALVAWLADRGQNRGKRLLLLVDDSIGIDPLDFYVAQLPAAAELAPAAESFPSAAELGNTLGAFGWTVVPVSLPAPSDDSGLQYRPTADLPVGFRLGLGGRNREAEAERQAEEELLALDPTPADRLEPLADATGGEVLRAADELPAILEGLRRRPLLRFRPPPDLLPGEYRLEVRPTRPALRVRAPAVVATATPVSVLEARLRQALSGEGDDGEVPVAATLLFDPDQAGRHPARLETQADLSELVEPPEQAGRPVVGPPMRVSVGVHLEGGDVVFRHEQVEPADLEAGGQWRHEMELMVPRETDAAVVLVERLGSGDWGIAYPEFVDRRLPADLEEARRFLRLLPPEQVNLQRGRVELQVVAEQEVRRVEYLLNGESVATKTRPPFLVKVDIDPTRPNNEVVAIGYDRDGTELDRDRLILTESADSFWVRIVEPAPGPQAGPVDVEASVKVPAGRSLDRVELYLLDEQVLTWRRAPYRGRIRIPVSSHGGYLRAAAYLTDGTISEDVVLLNRPGFGETIGVQLVELYVVATDRNGTPIAGLGREDFTILEDDLEQEIESFNAGADLPLSLGLAIDSSSSLFARLPDVQRAAKGFVRGLIEDRDRAFLIGFGMSPKLVRPITGDMSRLISGINSLTAYGTTPVWEAIVMSLTELEKLDGRRALVVFYDGDDEDQDFSYRACLQIARRARIPIYLIVMNNAAARTEGRSFSSRAFVGRLERLADAGGGRVYYVRTSEDLSEIFASISLELRSHYLLTYYPAPGGGPRWRPVSVEVNRRGVEARSIPGYGPPGLELDE